MSVPVFRREGGCVGTRCDKVPHHNIPEHVEPSSSRRIITTASRRLALALLVLHRASTCTDVQESPMPLAAMVTASSYK